MNLVKVPEDVVGLILHDHLVVRPASQLKGEREVSVADGWNGRESRRRLPSTRADFPQYAERW